MAYLSIVLAVLAVSYHGANGAATTHAPNNHAATTTTTPPPPTTEERVKHLEQLSEQLSRQMMLQQLYVEEKTRSEGDSGLKQIRERNDGSKTYFSATWTNINSMAAMHDHTDHIHTVGLGELTAVLNGLEFRTRHNDFGLKKPAHTRVYHATENIEYPAAPPAVTNKRTLAEQITEMKEWFKAWRDSNHTVRDYRPYFPSLLCYLEGAWTTNTKTLDEPFSSTRHQIDATSWFDLQEKIRFTSYTGDKSNKQNFAYLPTTIFNVTDGIPAFAQWNYRILCHPTKSYVETKELRPIDSLGVRLAKRKTFDQYLTTRAARYMVDSAPYSVDHGTRFTRLDELMAEIPGKDNYGANITDDAFGLRKYNVKDDNPLNTAYYHRWFRVLESGAMGEKTAHRGYADRNLFVATNSQPQIAPMTARYNCHNVGHGQHRHQVCQESTQRVSYAIPLEIIYLTPLNAWNPYEIEYKGDWHISHIRDHGRNGHMTKETAYNGTDSKSYYLTPAAFFSGAELDRDPADTARGAAGVLDRHGNLRAVKASGVRVTLPNIPDVGVLRTRYPIAPVFAEGNPIWKELEALRDVVLDMQKYSKYLTSHPVMATTPASHDVADHADTSDIHLEAPTLVTSPSHPEPVGLHLHTIELSDHDYRLLTEANQLLTVLTSEDNGHSHSLQIRYDRETGKVRIVSCDKKAECEDGHLPTLEREEDNIHMI